MSLTAVRHLSVVSFFVIGGLLICGSLYAGVAPYSSLEYSTVVNDWGTTFDDKYGNYNQGWYFAAWTGTGGNPNRDYAEMPQEDTMYIHELNARFEMQNTSWCASTVDTATVNPIFQTYDWDCNPATHRGAIYAMNDTDHIYVALQIPADQINSQDRLFLYFDPDNIQPVAEFVEGSGYCIGVKLGDVTLNEGIGNTVNEGMDFCNGHWMDWNNSGSIDTWEYGNPWPIIGDPFGITYPLENFTGNKDDLTICPRNASLWGDGGTVYPLSGAYWTNPDSLNTWMVTGFKADAIMLEFKIPIDQLGCGLALGSSIGFAIQFLDDMSPYDDYPPQACTPETSWWPTDIYSSGPPGPPQWEKHDATYMGTMKLNSMNIGNRLWGAWFDIADNRTTYLVLKNVSDDIAKTKVKFYESRHGDASERWAPLPGAGELILGSQCLEIPGHGVTTLQLESMLLLQHTKGCIEVTNVDLAGYTIAYIGLDSGALQKYAWSTDLEITPLSSAEWTALNGPTVEGMMLSNKWYIVGEPGWEFDTSVVIANPNPLNSATASIVLYPAVYYNPAIVTPTPNVCADTGFYPDFDDDYTGDSRCGDTTGDADDVINIPPHQAVELKMHELLNQWVANWDEGSISQEITDPNNPYWHFRKGTIEIHVQDGDDTEIDPDPEDRLDEALFGITARESANQGWGENLQRYYE